MPRFVQVFQDTCPTLTFSAGWQGGSSETDASLDRYSQGTYTFTKQEGETMTMTYNGTYVGIYGAKRPDHGLYQVELDGKLFPTFDAHSDTPLFNQTLFNATSLEYGLHTIKLINAGNTTLDVDYVAFQGVTGKAQEALIPATWQDNEFAFSYFPPSSWRQSARPGALSASTGTVTNDPRATAEFRFNVTDVILLYGPVSANSTTAFSVSMDNGPFFTFSARRAETRPHQVLYQASNLGRGEHVMRIKFEQPPNGTRMGDFTIDFANLYTARSLGGRPRHAYEVEAAMGTMQYVSKTPTSAIAGLSVTTAVAFLAILSTLYLWLRQRQRKMGDAYGDKKYIDLTE